MNLLIQNLSKKYNNDKWGLQDYQLQLNSGILGLLGPNGAGKSTLMKILATISRPTSGDVLLNGQSIVKEPDFIRKILGYLPQDFGVYPNLSAIEFLEYMAAVKGIGGKNLRNRIEQLLDSVNLTEAKNKPIGTYSGGMRQRVGIAQVLLNDPKVMIFDEPTVGLDPEERVRFRSLLSDLSGERIIILSSHIVSDIETIADQVAVMKGGKLLAFAPQSELIKKVQGKVFETRIKAENLEAFKQKFKIVHVMRETESLKVRFFAENNPQEVHFEAQTPNLEDAYLYLAH
jgi:ABC-type multidrug transport system ATPase subunit